MGRNRGADKFSHVLAQFAGPWLITQEKLSEIEAVLRARIESGNGPGAFDDDFDFDRRRDDGKGYTLNGSAALIPVHGTITPRPSLFNAFSGGTSAEQIGRAVDAAAADAKASAIVLDIDSPGGSVFGLPETGAKILAARKSKPVYAVANHLAASAAYWLATQANTIAVTPAGQVGSVGVIWAHLDRSGKNDKAGVRPTYITAGKYKAEGNQDNPLTEEAAAEMQRVVDEYYTQFVAAVARGRGVTTARVESDFGQGRMRLAQDAVSARMADRVATLEQVLKEINAKPATNVRPGTRAMTEDERIRTERTRRMVAADLARHGLRTDGK